MREWSRRLSLKQISKPKNDCKSFKVDGLENLIALSRRFYDILIPCESSSWPTKDTLSLPMVNFLEFRVTFFSRHRWKTLRTLDKKSSSSVKTQKLTCHRCIPHSTCKADHEYIYTD